MSEKKFHILCEYPWQTVKRLSFFSGQDKIMLNEENFSVLFSGFFESLEKLCFYNCTFEGRFTKHFFQAKWNNLK